MCVCVCFRALKPKLPSPRPQSFHDLTSQDFVNTVCYCIHSEHKHLKITPFPLTVFILSAGPCVALRVQRVTQRSILNPCNTSVVPGLKRHNVSLSMTSRQKRLPLIASRRDFVRSEFDAGGMTELCGCERNCVAKNVEPETEQSLREANSFQGGYWLCSLVFAYVSVVIF